MIYRSEKGEPLTFHELDGNFKELYELIHTLIKKDEAKTLVPEYLKEIKQEGQNLYFKGSVGSDLGVVTLPVVMPHPRGAWKKDEYYLINDWILFEKSTYACIKSHVAEAFEKQKEFWVMVVAGG